MRHHPSCRPAAPFSIPIAVTRRRVSRCTTWVFATALVLKSVVPMLASIAAAAQGRPVAEVCDVYGVKTIVASSSPRAALEHPAPHDHGLATAAEVHSHIAAATASDGGQSHEDPTEHAGAHASDHCALTGMVALAADPPSIAPRAEALAPVTLAPSATIAPHDAAARWAAQRRHGPPELS